MARKTIDKKTEYAVTRIGYCVGGDVEKAREMARRAGRLRSDIWNKYGSLQCWGMSAVGHIVDFKLKCLWNRSDGGATLVVSS